MKSNSKRSSKKSTKFRPIKMPLQPMKVSHHIHTKERVFLEAVERGDKHTVIRCLQEPNPVNVNCTNMLGRSGIQIAVDNENIELVEILLQQKGVKIGDALLYAIREGVYRIVEMLIDHPSITLEMLGPEWSKSKHREEESSDYSADISPIILAAHCNQFEILQLLILRGANIENPHQLSCSCKICQEQVLEDSLRHSLFRINSYRALASPAWISLTSPDPILSSFRLSWELEKLALRENEFKDTYMELSEQCKRYACDLLDQCRSSEEVIAVLNKESEDDSDDDEIIGGKEFQEKLTLSRLKLALKYEQKQDLSLDTKMYDLDLVIEVQNYFAAAREGDKSFLNFVAHPHCQQLLTSIWYEGLPGWRKRNGPTKFLLCMGLILIVPFMAVYYLIFPRSKIGQLLRSPFMKFLYHSASFGVFLILLVCLSTEFGADDDREQQRGPPPSQLEWLICFWVMGFVWAECKQLWEEGLKAYIRQWWNWLDFIMLSLYLATFSLRFVAYLQVESGRYGPRVLHRQYWPMLDPTLLSEGLFAVANVFSFSRIIYLAQANQHLGPLQISLGCMLIDIAKFLIIFFLVLTSFACGLNRLYWYYNKSKADDDPDAFFSLGESYVTLYWSLFGITRKNDITIRHGQYFTELMGMLMFMAYHGMAIIVLINMLIAMMSSSFQNIENHADMEWKFARSKLWMSYFDEGSTLPSPFNLIISPKSIWYIIRHVKIVVTSCTRERKQNHSNRRKRSSAGTIKTIESSVNYNRSPTGSDRPHFHGDSFKVPPSYDHIHYQDVMRRLVSRYIHQSKKKKQQDGVNEDDLLEIKQDISSLRYELRDDRKLESERANNLIQDLKHELICILHGIFPEKGPSMNPSRGGNLVNGATYCTLSKKDLQDIKRDIVESICTEVKSNLRESVIGFDSSGPPSSNLPSIDSELYQTHLYTQL